MDIALHYFDAYMGDKLYASLPTIPFIPSTSTLNSTISSSSSPLTSLLSYIPQPNALPRDHMLRQIISLYTLTYIGILVLYFSVATASYYLIFDKRMEQHPRFLPNQVAKEIKFSLQAFPMLDLLTLPIFLGDVRGYSMLYDSIEEGPFGKMGWWQPWLYMAVASAAFLFFTDLCIYWIHRWLHIPFFYKRLHKPHHKWIIPTPFASHAFHPVDGFLQSVPYHIICYLIPLHKYLFICLFSFVNLWSIFIHDSDMISNTGWEHYINGPAHHTLHHMYFTCNYGQYFVWADKVGGSFRLPAAEDDPLLAVIASQQAKKSQLLAEISVSKERDLLLEKMDMRDEFSSLLDVRGVRSGSTTPGSLSGGDDLDGSSSDFGGFSSREISSASSGSGSASGDESEEERRVSPRERKNQ